MFSITGASSFIESNWKQKTIKDKTMKIATKNITKGVRIAFAALTSLAISYCVLLAGWNERCDYYDETLVNFCGIGTSTNGLVCNGTCSYVRFPQGTARCGFCVPAWVGYCNNAPTGTMVTVNTYVGNCIGPFQVLGSSGSVTWECTCPTAYMLTGTTTVGCWCW
jgi:hypothetical protein